MVFYPSKNDIAAGAKESANPSGVMAMIDSKPAVLFAAFGASIIGGFRSLANCAFTILRRKHLVVFFWRDTKHSLQMPSPISFLYLWIVCIKSGVAFPSFAINPIYMAIAPFPRVGGDARFTSKSLRPMRWKQVKRLGFAADVASFHYVNVAIRSRNLKESMCG